MTLTLDRPWLSLDLGVPHQVLSWAINRPGRVQARHILWREVRNADLPEDLDVRQWFARELAARGAQDAVGLLTSRDIRAFHDVSVTVDGITARCVATVGLSNAEHIGRRVDRTGKDWGTINLALHLSAALTDAALTEALAIAAQARTVAVMSVAHGLPTGIATGTGTDCIAVAARKGTTEFAGMHTAVGEAAGRAVHDAVAAGAAQWMEHIRRPGDV
jgi:adenosylcobinamide amidohydrolase